jgi:hypothetical protein
MGTHWIGLTIPQAPKNAATATDVQVLDSMQDGFKLLRASNSELASQLMLDMLDGIRQ